MKQFTYRLGFSQLGLARRGFAMLVGALLFPVVAGDALADPGRDLEGAPSWVLDACGSNQREGSSAICTIAEAKAEQKAEPEGGADLGTQTSSAGAGGQTETSHALDARVRSMLASFRGASAAGRDVMVAATAPVPTDVAQAVAVALQGATSREVWISPDGTVYSLMALDVEKFQRAVWADEKLDPSLRTHLARTAPRELDGAPEPLPSRQRRGRLDPLTLITAAEFAGLPQDVPISRQVRQSEESGPVIRIDNPENQGTYNGPFPIRVEFLVRPNGHPVDMESLKLEYKKAWGIDITDRVREYVAGTTIDVAESNLPRGRHTVEILISDTRGNRSSELFSVTVE